MRDLLQALEHGRIAPLIDSVRTVLLLDAADYDWFVEMSPTFVDAQIGLAQLILVNKVDLAEPELVQSVVDDLEERNPEAVVLPTTFGAFSWDDVAPLLPALPSAEGPSERLSEYESFSAVLPETFVLERLRLFFHRRGRRSLRRRAAGEGGLPDRGGLHAPRPGRPPAARGRVGVRRRRTGQRDRGRPRTGRASARVGSCGAVGGRALEFVVRVR